MKIKDAIRRALIDATVQGMILPRQEKNEKLKQQNLMIKKLLHLINTHQ